MATTIGPIIPTHATSFDARKPAAVASRPPTKSASTSSSDPYYGHESIAKLCGRVVTHLFTCPDYPPPSTATPPGPSPQLAMFVAYALHRTRLHVSVTFAALYLLQRLKQRFPAARGSSGHRLFLSAFMIASKVICDDTYSNKSWSIVGQGMFALREVNQMEREMCAYLDWELNVDPDCLKQFEALIREGFSGPGPYKDVPLPLPASKASSTYAHAPSATITIAGSKPARSNSAPNVYPSSIPKNTIDDARRYPTPDSSPESPSTPDSSHSSTVSPEPSPEPRTPENIEQVHARIVRAEAPPPPGSEAAMAHGYTATSAIKARYMQQALQAEPGAPANFSVDGGNYDAVADGAPIKARAARTASYRHGPTSNPYAFATPIAW
jgi:hypothetical protein